MFNSNNQRTKKRSRFIGLFLTAVMLCSVFTWMPAPAFAESGDSPSVIAGGGPSVIARSGSDEAIPGGGPSVIARSVSDEAIQDEPGVNPGAPDPGGDSGGSPGGNSGSGPSVIAGSGSDEAIQDGSEAVSDPGEEPLLAPLSADVCEINGIKYPSIGDALVAVNAAALGSSTTIKLLADTVYEGCIIVVGKTLIFDLNGKTLNVSAGLTGSASNGLIVGADSGNIGQVLIKDPLNGEFNVEGTYGVNIIGGSKAEVTNVNATVFGVRAWLGSNTVTVFGEVKAAETGVSAEEGSRVFVRGDVSVFPGKTDAPAVQAIKSPTTPGSMIAIGGAVKTAPGNPRIKTGALLDTIFDSSVRPGYICYADGNPSSTASCVVWVRDPVAAFSCEILGGYKYRTLDEAIMAVLNGQTIRLLENISYGTSYFEVRNGMTFNLDLNGKNLTVDSQKTFRIYMNSDVTIEYNGGSIIYDGVVQVGANTTGGKLTLPYVNSAFSLSCERAGSTITVKGDIATTNSACAVYAKDGGYIWASGNIRAANLAKAAGNAAVKANNGKVRIGGNITSSYTGVSALSSGEVTIDGTLTVPSGSAYIIVNGAVKAKNQNEATSAVPDYLTYLNNADTSSVVWVKDPNIVFVCEIVSTGVRYKDVQSAVTAAPTGVWPNPGPETRIRMLANYTQNSTLSVQSNRNILLDLNGKTLNVVCVNSHGLYIFGSGRLRLADPYNGAFNISITSNTGFLYYGISAQDNAVAEATGVKAAGIYTKAVQASGSACDVRVFGDAEVGADSNLGVNAYNGAKVTIDGKLTVPDGVNYIVIGSGTKAPNENTAPSTKPGYLEYSDPADTYKSRVWIKDPSFKPVCELAGVGRYDDLQAAINAVPDGSRGTIKMLKDYTRVSDSGPAIQVGGSITQEIILDLNGKTVNAVSTGGGGTSGLYVRHTSTLKLKDPGNGLFNVSGIGSGIRAETSCQAEASNVKASHVNNAYGVDSRGGVVTVYGDVSVITKNSGGNTFGVYCINGGKATVMGEVISENNVSTSVYGLYSLGNYSSIEVKGDVRSIGNYGGNRGVYVADGGKVTIDGAIIGPQGTGYIYAGSAMAQTPAAKHATLMQEYFMYSSVPSNPNALASSTVWVRDPAIDCVVTFGMLTYYYSFAQARAYIQGSGTPSLPAGGSATVKLLRDIDRISSISIDNKNIVIDLNGYTLNLHSNLNSVPFGGETFLSVKNGGSLRLLDPENGEFNITVQQGYGVLTSDGAGGYAEVTNVNVAGSGLSSVGAYADKGNIVVFGDVTIGASRSGDTAVIAGIGSSVTVKGKIKAPESAVYISVYSNIKKGPNDHEPVSGKAGYLEYVGTGATPGLVWVKDPKAFPVCSIEGKPYYSLDDALAVLYAKPAGSATTIKLLHDIDYRNDNNSWGGAINIDNRSLILDLNGYRLNVTHSFFVGYGLDVRNNGSVTLLEPHNGEFNVCGAAEGVHVSYGRAEVTNAAAAGTVNTTSGSGVSAYSGEVIVYGDVSVKKNFSVRTYGVSLSTGGKVTVHGSVNVPQGANYINAYAPGDFIKDASGNPVSTKVGYLMYTSNASNPTSSTVVTAWVRDPKAFAPVENIIGVPDSVIAGSSLTLSGVVAPAHATNKTISWSLVNPGATGATLKGNILSTISTGIVSVRASVAGGNEEGIAFTKLFSIKVEPEPISLISLSPSHLILHKGDPHSGAHLTATFSAGAGAPYTGSSDDFGKVVWSITKSDGSPSADVRLSVAGGGRNATAYLNGSGIQPQLLLVTATYAGKYSATATVEVIDHGVPGFGSSAKVLASNVTVNSAATVGALLPVFITNLGSSEYSIITFADPAPGSPAATGASGFEVELRYKAGTSWTTLPGYAARMSGADNRHIEIDALAGAANQKNVKVIIKPKTPGAQDIDAGTINITVAAKYPRISVKAGDLNLAYPTRGAALTVTSPDGVCTLHSAAPAKAADAARILHDNGTLRHGPAAKTGNVSMNVNVSVEGYKPIPASKMPKVTVKVVDTTPKVKLASGSVTLLPAPAGGAANIELITADKKVPFESGYRVSNVSLSPVNAAGKAVSNPDIIVSYSGGVVYIQPKAGCKNGTALIKVSFMDSPKAVYLPLKITMLDTGNPKTLLTPTAGAASFPLSVEHETGAKIADIPIKLNAANISFSDWAPVGWSTELSNAISLTPGINKVTLTVKDKTALETLLVTAPTKKCALTIGSQALNGLNAGPVKMFNVTLNLTGQNASGISKIAVKGKIDITSPGSAVTASLQLKGTTSEIGTVTLETVNPAGTVSKDFKVTGINGNTFRIEAAHKYVIPGVKQPLFANVKMKNGQELQGRIDVTPVQGANKAWQGKKAITLDKLTPLTGETVGLKLTTPGGVKTGAVCLNQASLKALPLVQAGGGVKSDGFKLVRAGENDYTIYFADGKAPWPKTGGDAKRLKPSYSIKVELWAEGAYTIGADGKPAALGYYDSKGKWVAKSKPTIVTVTVNIK